MGRRSPVIMRNTQHHLGNPNALRDAQRAGAEFLLTDIDVAFTLLRSAAISRDELSSGRDRQIARSAYDTVSMHLREIPPDFPQRLVIESRLQALGRELVRMGETL
jgi:hypothetical protein